MTVSGTAGALRHLWNARPDKPASRPASLGIAASRPRAGPPGPHGDRFSIFPAKVLYGVRRIGAGATASRTAMSRQGDDEFIRPRGHGRREGHADFGIAIQSPSSASTAISITSASVAPDVTSSDTSRQMTSTAPGWCSSMTALANVGASRLSSCLLMAGDTRFPPRSGTSPRVRGGASVGQHRIMPGCRMHLSPDRLPPSRDS